MPRGSGFERVHFARMPQCRSPECEAGEVENVQQTTQTTNKPVSTSNYVYKQMMGHMTNAADRLVVVLVAARRRSVRQLVVLHQRNVAPVLPWCAKALKTTRAV